MGRPTKEMVLARNAAAIGAIGAAGGVQHVGNIEQVPTKCKCGVANIAQISRRDAFFAAAMAGLIARGGTSMDNLIRTAKQYADEAEAAAGDA